MFRLLRYFSIAGLVAIVLAALVLGWIFRHVEFNNLLALGEGQNVALAQAFSNSLWPLVNKFVHESTRLQPQEIKNYPVVPLLEHSVRHLIGNLPVARIKIYNNRGITIFSTQVEQIGESQWDNAMFQSALSGVVSSEMIHRHSFPSIDGKVENRDLISSYVPLLHRDHYDGAFELYYDVTLLLQRRERTQYQVLGGVMGLFMVLYGVLFAIVRRADRILKYQNDQLTRLLSKIRDNNATLEQRVAERTETLEQTNQVLTAEIATRQQAEESLRRSEMHMRTIMDNVVEGIVTVNRAGTIETINPAVVRMFGYEQEQLVGSNLTILVPIPPETCDNGDMEAGIMRCLAGLSPEAGFIDREITARRCDGTAFPMELTLSDVCSGDAEQFIATLRDVSSRKQAEIELAEARRKSFHQEKMAAIGTLAAGIVHEIGNPIAALMGLVEELYDYSPAMEPMGRELLATIQEQIQRLATISRDVSTLSMPHADGLQLLDLNTLIEGAVRLMRFDKRMRRVNCSLDLDRELPALLGSETQIRQVLINLLINAADAMEGVARERPEVIISSMVEDNMVRVIVTDNGAGMSAEVLAHAMDAFFTTKSMGRGTGLGLSLCYSILHAHRGYMEIESALGVGTRIHLLLPIQGCDLEQLQSKCLGGEGLG